jgi:acyl carrier protein
MSQTDERLLRCFQAVFPNLDERQITKASTQTVSEWDSVSTVTLASVIEEEFGIQFEGNELENLTSFQEIRRRLPA